MSALIIGLVIKQRNRISRESQLIDSSQWYRSTL